MQRVLIAIFPGYFLSNCFSIILSYTLPIEKTAAVELAVLLSFIFYLAIIMWVFSVSHLSKLWIQLLIALIASTISVYLCTYLGNQA